MTERIILQASKENDSQYYTLKDMNGLILSYVRTGFGVNTVSTKSLAWNNLKRRTGTD